MVSSEVLSVIQIIAHQNPRVEACGLITSTDEIIKITNVSKTPDHSFVFSKREYFKALNSLREKGQTIQCIFHTHPGNSSEPSKADLEFVRLSKRNSLIVSAKDYRWLNAKN